jgi:hypothetical protein
VKGDREPASSASTIVEELGELGEWKHHSRFCDGGRNALAGSPAAIASPVAWRKTAVLEALAALLR